MRKIHASALGMVLVIRFLTMVGFGIIIPVLPFLVRDLGGNAFMLGLFLSIYSVMQFLFSPYWGRVSDRIGRKPVLMIGLLGYGVTFILFGLVHHLYLLIIIRALSGLVSSATLPTTMAYVSDISDASQRAKVMGFIGAASGFGMIIGPAFGGLLSTVSYGFSFFVAGGLALILFFLAAFFLPESLPQSQRAPREKRTPGLGVLREPLLIAYLFNFVLLFATSMFETTFAYIGAAGVGMTATKMGFIFAVVGVVSVVVQLGLISRMVAALGEAKVVLLGCLISALGLLAIVFAAHFSHFSFFVFSAVFYYVGTAFATPANASLVSLREEKKHGVNLGYYSSFGSLGRILGPLIGGAMYAVDPYTAYYLGAFVFFCMVFGLGNRLRRLQPESKG